MAKIQCDNEECRFRTQKGFCKFKEILKDKKGNCKTFSLKDDPYEIVIVLPSKEFAEKCKEEIGRYIYKTLGYECEIRKVLKI